MGNILSVGHSLYLAILWLESVSFYFFFERLLVIFPMYPVTSEDFLLFNFYFVLLHGEDLHFLQKWPNVVINII